MEEINIAIQNILGRELLDQQNNFEGAGLFHNTDLLNGESVSYDLYCSDENRTYLDTPYYENEMYVFIVITEIGSAEMDWSKENQIYVFCVTDEGIELSLYNEIHSADENVSATLLNDSQKLGSFTMRIELDG